MKKAFLLSLIIALVIFSFAVTKDEGDRNGAGRNSNVLENIGVGEGEEKETRREIRVGGKEFKVIVSDTPELRERGLSGRTGLADDEAMLFIFDEPDFVGFWMKDMLFSIDIMWVDENLKIVSIEKDVSPETFPKVFYPKAPVRYVLEFNSGTIDRLVVREGDAVAF